MASGRGGWQFAQPPTQWFGPNRDSPQWDGLVGWWSAFAYRAGGWGLLRDVLGRYNLTTTNSPTVTTSTMGPVVLLDDASTEYLSVAAAPVAAPPFTMSVWFNSDTVALTQTLMGIFDGSTDTAWHRLLATGAAGGDPIRAQSMDGATSHAVTTTGYAADTWHLATGVWSAANARAAFIDGGSKGTETTSRTPAGLDSTAIGVRGSSSLTQYFSGMIAEVRIYDCALSDTKVAALYDPRTRWDLYAVPRRSWVVPAVAGISIPVVMHHRQQQRIAG